MSVAPDWPNAPPAFGAVGGRLLSDAAGSGIGWCECPSAAGSVSGLGGARFGRRGMDADGWRSLPLVAGSARVAMVARLLPQPKASRGFVPEPWEIPSAVGLFLGTRHDREAASAAAHRDGLLGQRIARAPADSGTGSIAAGNRLCNVHFAPADDQRSTAKHGPARYRWTLPDRFGQIRAGGRFLLVGSLRRPPGLPSSTGASFAGNGPQRSPRLV